MRVTDMYPNSPNVSVPGYSAHDVSYYTNRAYVLYDRQTVCIDPVSPALATVIARYLLGVENVIFRSFNSSGHAVYRSN